MKGIIRFISVTLAAVAVILNFSMPVSAACVKHDFYQKYLAAGPTTTVDHMVRDKNGNQVKCTITITYSVVVDVCKNCNYSSSSYLVQASELHSVNH